jgi:hypothetical protein
MKGPCTAMRGFGVFPGAGSQPGPFPGRPGTECQNVAIQPERPTTRPNTASGKPTAQAAPVTGTRIAGQGRCSMSDRRSVTIGRAKRSVRQRRGERGGRRPAIAAALQESRSGLRKPMRRRRNSEQSGARRRTRPRAKRVHSRGQGVQRSTETRCLKQAGRKKGKMIAAITPQARNSFRCLCVRRPCRRMCAVASAFAHDLPPRLELLSPSNKTVTHK